jgi:hypothetical protein
MEDFEGMALSKVAYKWFHCMDDIVMIQPHDQNS